jgi:hypothetical protein
MTDLEKAPCTVIGAESLRGSIETFVSITG